MAGTSSAGAGTPLPEDKGVPWAAIPRFSPGTTDLTEYSQKLEFLAAMWPKELMPQLAPRAALLCEGTAFRKVTRIEPSKLKTSDDSGVKLLVATLGGSWGQTDLEKSYDYFERAIFGTIQKSDETHDSYIARHDVHFDEMIAQGTTLDQIRAYVLLRQSQLSSEDRKRIVVESGGKLEYARVAPAIRLLGSRFFSDLQGQRVGHRNKVYDVHVLEEALLSESEPQPGQQANLASGYAAWDEPDDEIEPAYLAAMVAAEDGDALHVQGFEDELEAFMQDTPEMYEALVSYTEARSRLLAKKRSRGFWPVGSGNVGSKGSQGSSSSKGGRFGKGKHAKGKSGREQLLLRIQRSSCRNCGQRGHWKAECPLRNSQSAPGPKADATVAEAIPEEAQHADQEGPDYAEIILEPPSDSMCVAEALFVQHCLPAPTIRSRLRALVENTRTLRSPRQARKPAMTPCFRHSLRPSRTWSEMKAPSSPPECRASMCHHGFESSPACREEASLTVSTMKDGVMAILDTGASRCVMGEDLMPKFLKQLSTGIREQIKVVPSQVKFRFGNNQTLLSKHRLLIPIQCRPDCLYLTVEIVPGATPLLFSKRAIKQLGGIIDTSTDSCYLQRLHRDLPLKTGPTGLYLIDLASLCEESRGAECLAASDDCLNLTHQPRALHVTSILSKESLGPDSGSDPGSFPVKSCSNSDNTSKHHVMPGSDNVPGRRVTKIPPANQRTFSFRSRHANPGAVHAKSQDHDQQPECPSIPEPCVATLAPDGKQQVEGSPAGSSEGRSDSPQQNALAGRAFQPPPGAQLSAHRRAASCPGHDNVRRFRDHLREDGSWTDLPICGGRQSHMDSMGPRTPGRFQQAGASSVHAVRGAVLGRGRDHRIPAAPWRIRGQSPRRFPGASGSDSRSHGCRAVGCRGKSPRLCPEPGAGTVGSHEPDGGTRPADVGCNPTADLGPEVDAQAVEQCLHDLRAICQQMSEPDAKDTPVSSPDAKTELPLNESLHLSESASPAEQELATSLRNAQRLLDGSTLPQQADGSMVALDNAFHSVQEVLWDTFADSLLSYNQPTESQLDLLEVYAYPDSRLTEAVRECGGRAQRFTRQDGDLSTVAGQRALYELIQRTQPRSIWMAPDCRLWGSWSSFNGSRSTRAHLRLQTDREQDRVHLRLCARIHAWQTARGRHFHLEQPELSKMLEDEIMRPIIMHCHQTVVDMCAFGLKTPITRVPIRKRTAILTTHPELAKSLEKFRCKGVHVHHTIAGSIQDRQGRRLATSRFAGSYCKGFAKHIARCILPTIEESYTTAVATEPPRMRKRFKSAAQKPVPQSDLSFRKRQLPEHEDAPVPAIPKVEHTSDVRGANQVLPETIWEPVFDLAIECTTRATPSLVPAEHRLVTALRERIRGLEVLQVFVGKKSRTLHSPMGALPATVAPVRLSLALLTSPARGFTCLGQEDRTKISPERKRLPIKGVQVLITVLGRAVSGPSSESPSEMFAPQVSPAEPSVSVEPTAHQRQVPEVPSTEQDMPTSEAMVPEGMLPGWPAPPTPVSGPAFQKLTKEAKAELIRIHRNLGHPTPAVLSKHLKAAGVDQALVDAARDYQCDTCLESVNPRHQRPGKLHLPLEFNHLIGIDGFHFRGQSGYRAYVIHAIDEASCFHLGRRALTKHSAVATRLLHDFWCSWAGMPREIYLDPAGEFRSEELLSHFQGHNVKLFTTTSAWQRGRIERHGDVLKHMLHRLDIERAITTPEAFDEALLQCFQAKNSLMRHDGYSPEQIVLGRSLNVPGSTCSDEHLASHSLAAGTDLEAESHRRRLDLRCRARCAFLQADNNAAIRRASLRRSTPVRGPYPAGAWVLYWVQKSSPDRLSAGKWHGPAKVIVQEGSAVVWVSHGTKIVRCSPESLRPASHREFLSLSPLEENPSAHPVGGASSMLDLTRQSPPEIDTAQPVSTTNPVSPPPALIEVPIASSSSQAALPLVHTNTPEDLHQPEQEMTPQVSAQAPSHPTGVPPEVELIPASSPGFGAPSGSEVPVPPSVPSELPAPHGAENTPLPENAEDNLLCEHVLLATEETGLDDLYHFTALSASACAICPPLAEDDLPFVAEPLVPSEHQAFCLEVPLKSRDVHKWKNSSAPEQMAAIATAGKRARAEVCLKNLSVAELALFDEAKRKEIQCWIQTSAIRAILRKRLNPDQILRSRWVLTWKTPEPGEKQPRAKARLVVLGFQDPKLTEVNRDAPTLSREGRALVLQTAATMQFQLGSFDIKTAFLRGKADSANPLAMDPPKELRAALGLKDDEVCQLLGNAYGRVDAPLLFYKELCQQLTSLGFVRHPLEPCVFTLSTGNKLHGILGMHVDDGVFGGDQVFLDRISQLQKKLPFGSQKSRSFTFTGIHLEQFPDYSIRASQAEYVRAICQIDIGRPRRLQPDAEVSESERSKLRGLIGSLQYAVSHTRPDIAAKLGEIQTQVTTATVQTLLQANKVLREAQEQSDVCLYYLPIPREDITFASFGDASFANSRNLSSHQGSIICATSRRLNENVDAPLVPMVWISKKIPRVVRSTLSAEAYSMSKSIDALGWIRSLWGTVHVPNFPWSDPAASYAKLNKAVIITDCRSLYDLVTRLAMPSCEEFRTTLEVLLIKQRCAENAVFRWIPTTLMLADSLTKAMDPTLLRTVLAQGRFRLYDSSQTLEKTAQRKEAVAWLGQPSRMHLPPSPGDS